MLEDVSVEDVEAASGPHEVRNSRKYVPMHSAITARQNSKLLKEKKNVVHRNLAQRDCVTSWIGP